ncbi:conjugation system SOS inhibitor PsiB family protein [Pantoea rodasii]|uniref:conjugation system SOS inhibitor PsiB family protein n=1 Tax=Pantoea rodasii TaxID=1076549 RepID=UPI00068BB352|nr:conjugation system SOS inhibitor PsiB family protein [Pantoea rodasii]
MTQQEKFTLNTLQTFTGCDFEAYRHRGEAFRQRLSGAVLNALQLPDSWRTDCEMRSEWGGAYPVHLRLTRADVAGLVVELVSPSSDSPLWCAVLTDLRTRSRVSLNVSYRFEPATLRTRLEKIAEYTRAGFTGAGELVAALRMGGHAA